MTERQRRISELMFTMFILNLFERTTNPASAMAWLRATCTLLQKDETIMQRLVLGIMGRPLSLIKISDELGYILLASNQSVNGIIKLAARSRAQVYRHIKLYPQQGQPLKLTFTDEDARFAAEFLKAFDAIGGILN